VTEYEDEPIRGLPGHLPPGERILWQGAPDARTLARSAFRLRWVAAYFGALALAGLVAGRPVGAGLTAIAGLLCVGLVQLLAFAIARTSVYTLTDRRVVLRIGVALNACFNLPLKTVAAADLKPLGGGHGDIALTLEGGRIGYLFLWPHARPWRLRQPQPMLRAVPDATQAAALLVRARAAIGPIAAAPAPAEAAPAADAPSPAAIGAAA
jgi:hypothetical protein